MAAHRRGGARRRSREPLTPEQQAALVQQARTAGFATIKSAIAWANQQWGLTLSGEQMARPFRLLQLRPKLPRPIPGRADPAAQERWKRGG